MYLQGLQIGLEIPKLPSWELLNIVNMFAFYKFYLFLKPKVFWYEQF